MCCMKIGRTCVLHVECFPETAYGLRGEGRVQYVFSCNVEGQGMYMILGMWCGRIVTPKSTPKSARCSHGVYFSAEHTLLFGKTYLAFRPQVLY